MWKAYFGNFGHGPSGSANRAACGSVFRRLNRTEQEIMRTFSTVRYEDADQTIKRYASDTGIRESAVWNTINRLFREAVIERGLMERDAAGPSIQPVQPDPTQTDVKTNVSIQPERSESTRDSVETTRQERDDQPAFTRDSVETNQSIQPDKPEYTLDNNQ